MTPRQAPWVLMYHSVDAYEQDPNLLTVMPERFARQMSWLAGRGLRGVGIAELLHAHARGEAASLVGLTFDDGYADFARNVMPVLARHGFSATVYVVAGRIGGHNEWDAGAPRKELLTVEQVGELADAGVEIGSHGLTHVRMPGLGAAALLAETVSSREILEGITGRPVDGFCYPYGALDRATVSAVRRAGYRYAVGIDHSELTGRWAVPRCYVGDHDGSWRLRAKHGRHLVRGLRTAVAARFSEADRSGATGVLGPQGTRSPSAGAAGSLDAPTDGTSA
ncbi:polysaccharide deacetylase family protein [Kitasatospora sp. NPDC048296]|uniref:polysaccharide deacetylase family protein n=1 Tax=Kitasatospora sp. NPDC048296 TaxID=3364048 RepID=UPI00371917D4